MSKQGKIQHVLIMAAGRGIRMMPLTDIIPKAMIPYNSKGTTIIAVGIKRITKYIKNVHITVGYKGAILAKHVIELNVNTVFNTSKKGNSWWLFNTLLKYLDEPIFVLTCDHVTDLDWIETQKEYFRLRQPACMIVPVKPVPGVDGDYIFHKKNRVIAIDRHKQSGIYCSGIQILNPAKINRLVKPSENFSDVWKQLIRKKHIYCSSLYPKKWFSIDTIDQLQRLRRSS